MIMNNRIENNMITDRMILENENKKRSVWLVRFSLFPIQLSEINQENSNL